MLNKIGILSDSEKNFILGGLDKIHDEIENGEFSFKIADEDIHMAIERRLVPAYRRNWQKAPHCAAHATTKLRLIRAFMCRGKILRFKGF